MSSLKNTFWDRLADVRTGMLSADTSRAVPMSHYTDAETGNIWFITANGTDVATSATGGAKAEYIVSSDKEGLYARIDGTLSAVTDPDKLDELWNAVAAAWFEDGKRDPDTQLVKFTPNQAEVWTTDGALSFLYEIAKANMTDESPDTGNHGTITF